MNNNANNVPNGNNLAQTMILHLLSHHRKMLDTLVNPSVFVKKPDKGVVICEMQYHISNN